MGRRKNDCERNAAKRLLVKLREDHPHLKLIVVEDGLASNGPHIELLKSLKFRFILGAKPSDHTTLFEFIDGTPPKALSTYELTDKAGTHHRFRYMNDVSLNDTNEHIKVNFLEYWETSAKGKEQHFSWVTDITLNPSNVMKIMRGGRARWKIENETFNTLKNQGYHFEHNYGHGDNHLSTVFANLMLLAFLIDQIQQRCCPLFQEALKKAHCKLYYWNHLRSLFLDYEVPSWEILYQGMAFGIKKPRLEPDMPDTS